MRRAVADPEAGKVLIESLDFRMLKKNVKGRKALKIRVLLYRNELKLLLIMDAQTLILI